MEDKNVEKTYKIKIIDTYIDKNTGLLARNFGKTLEVPKDISDDRAKEMIKKKIAKVVVENDVQTKSNKKPENKS